ncbi:SAG1250 family conjugative relaxase [Streptococcus sp. E24BD]|uniref:SAG1250 family conjugative relaxase n=1 Tax=Streptococcus sp. E24BD TaxID=3278715 RepID=UPI00359DC509
MENRYRTNLKKVFLTDQELATLNDRIGQSGCKNFSAYARKVLLNPNMTFLTIDTSNYEELVFELKRIGNNLNQMIQSFSPEDNLTAEEINSIGYETIKELTGGNFRFIVTTHTDKDHIHNHILINSIDLNSYKKLKWDYAQERNLRLISDRLAKEAGAKILPPNRYSHEQFETYRKTNHKFELKQRLYFLMENSKSFEDFMAKAPALNVEMDFSRKHARFFMTDRDMKQVIHGNQLDKRQPYTEDYFREHFAKRAIEQRLDFILPRARDLSHLLEIAEQLNLKISQKKKHVTFTLKEDDRTISIENKKVSTKHLYDVQFFEEYFDNRDIIPDPDLTNLVSDFETYQEEQDKDKLPSEELLAAYKDFKEKRDKIQEFEVVLVDHQLDKLVKDGIFIKMTYGIKKDGLVFIPNRNLDIHESEQGKTYHVFIRETAQFFIYNKESSDLNRYMRGRELIRQLTHDSKHIPKRRRPTIASLKEKIAEVNLLIELDLNNQSYQEIKDELIKDIAQLDLTITDLQDKVAHLNKVAEVLINLNNSDPENRRLAKYDYAKMNLTPTIKLEQVEKEIAENQKSMMKWIDDYEYKIRRLEKFVQTISQSLSFLDRKGHPSKSEVGLE